MTPCWIQQHGVLVIPNLLGADLAPRVVPVRLHPVMNACDGRIDPCHLIPQQLLKRELGSRKAGWEQLVVAGCRRHHRLMDEARRIKIPRDALPAEVERFAADHQLVWFLDQEYGFPHSRAEPSEGDHQGESVPSPEIAGGSAG